MSHLENVYESNTFIFLSALRSTKPFLTLQQTKVTWQLEAAPFKLSWKDFVFPFASYWREPYREERPWLLVPATCPQQSKISMLNHSAVAAICPEKLQNEGHFQYPHTFQSTTLAWTLTVCVCVFTQASCWCIKFTLKFTILLTQLNNADLFLLFAFECFYLFIVFVCSF